MSFLFSTGMFETYVAAVSAFSFAVAHTQKLGVGAFGKHTYIYIRRFCIYTYYIRSNNINEVSVSRVHVSFFFFRFVYFDAYIAAWGIFDTKILNMLRYLTQQPPSPKVTAIAGVLVLSPQNWIHCNDV